MIWHRMRLLANLDPNQLFKAATLFFISSNIIMLLFIAIFYFAPDNSILPIDKEITSLAAHLLPAILWFCNAICAVLLAFMWRKCHNCRNRFGRQIINALEKMGKGELGWKITLRRGNELSEVANSVSDAHKRLAQRIAEIQTKTREISEAEDFLFDSLGLNRSLRPQTLNALRKLKIGLNRLKSDIDRFHLSLLPEEKEHHNTPTLP